MRCRLSNRQVSEHFKHRKMLQTQAGRGKEYSGNECRAARQVLVLVSSFLTGGGLGSVDFPNGITHRAPNVTCGTVIDENEG